MDKKILIAAAACVVIAVVAVAVIFSDDPENDVPEPKYTITYDGNGGVTSEGKTSVTLECASILDNMFTNGSYTFSGWNTMADGSGFDLPVGYVLGGGTIYAQWKVQVTADSINVTADTFEVWSSFGDDIEGPLETGNVKLYSEVPELSIITSDYTIDVTEVSEVTFDSDAGELKFKITGSKSSESDGFYLAKLQLVNASVSGFHVSSTCVGVVIVLEQNSADIHVSVTLTKVVA